uniref:Uncharacterized protein n=1 Tax=Arundo donax TaxID=35708 RepID=A0A0A9EQ25_ARUDO
MYIWRNKKDKFC